MSPRPCLPMDTPAQVFRFGPYESRPRSRELYKHGLKLKVRPQPLQVLNLLLNRAGDVVSREVLREELWSAETFVDFEHSLNTAVKEIRATLGDSPLTPRYIETLPRLGYRFIAPVEVINGVSDLVSSPAPTASNSNGNSASVAGTISADIPASGIPGETARQNQNRHPYLWLAVALAAVGVALAISAMIWSQKTEYFWQSPIADARFQMVTDFDGIEEAAAVSRDGHFVAFLSDRDGQMDVWVTQAGSGEFHNLTRGMVPELVNPSVRTLGFSPDGSLVTFWVRKKASSTGSDISIWAVPTLGGQPRPYLEDVAELDWSRDGSRHRIPHARMLEIRCSCQTAAAYRTVLLSSLRLPVSTLIFSSGRPTRNLSTSCRVLFPTNWISGASLQRAGTLNESPRTIHASPIRSSWMEEL